MNLPLRREEAAIITVALGVLDLVLFKSRYPEEVQNEISERCKELIERIQRVRDDFESNQTEEEERFPGV